MSCRLEVTAFDKHERKNERSGRGKREDRLVRIVDAVRKRLLT